MVILAQQWLPVPLPGHPCARFAGNLEASWREGGSLRRIALEPLPFRVGRFPTSPDPRLGVGVEGARRSSSCATAPSASGDLGSKNGTLVKHERVAEAPLREGDILHFAQVEFRVGRQEIDDRDEQASKPSTVSLFRHEAPAAVRRGHAGAAAAPPGAAGDLGLPADREPAERHPRRLRGARPRAAPTAPRAPLEPLPHRGGGGAEAELSQLFRETALELVVVRGGLPAVFPERPPRRAREARPRPRGGPRPAEGAAAAADPGDPRGGARRPRERGPPAHAAQPAPAWASRTTTFGPGRRGSWSWPRCAPLSQVDKSFHPGQSTRRPLSRQRPADLARVGPRATCSSYTVAEAVEPPGSRRVHAHRLQPTPGLLLRPAPAPSRRSRTGDHERLT